MSNELTKYTGKTDAPDRAHLMIYVCAYLRKEKKDKVFNRILKVTFNHNQFFLFSLNKWEKEIVKCGWGIDVILYYFFKNYGILPDFIKYFFF